MSEELDFLDYEGLNDLQTEDLKLLISSQVKNPYVEFPWDWELQQNNHFSKGDGTFLNVHAPVFKSSLSSSQVLTAYGPAINNAVYYNNFQNAFVTNSNSLPLHPSGMHGYQHSNYSNPDLSIVTSDTNGNCIVNSPLSNNDGTFQTAPSSADIAPALNHFTTAVPYGMHIIGAQLPMNDTVVTTNNVNAGFKLNPTVTSFVPQNTSGLITQVLPRPHDTTSTDVNDTLVPVQNDSAPQIQEEKTETVTYEKNDVPASSVVNTTEQITAATEPPLDTKDSLSTVEHSENELTDVKCSQADNKQCENAVSNTQSTNVSTPINVWGSKSSTRSFADVLKSNSEPRTTNSVSTRFINQKSEKSADNKVLNINKQTKSSLAQDKMSLKLGRYLYEVQLDFTPIYLQPRGLVNSRNWCYINATLQALLACSPFYTLLRNLPVGPGVDRGVSSTPVIDSMVTLVYEFVQAPSPQEDVQPGAPFPPSSIYEMLGILKSGCLKGQQEDAEEFLSYILNGMHEEMVSLIKNYEETYKLNPNEEVKSNGHTEVSEEEEEWQVIGTKQKGMVTRKVVEHKTPVSDLLGGQITSFLTTSGNKTSASVQPFFTLQLDIQAESVSSVEEALNQMTIKEPIQGYTCTKTKQEVEAYSRVTLQKLPPVLILHLKRFVYNKNGGCKKVMKQTEYPINLEFKKELFSTEARKLKRPHSYTLFAVMYHDGEEAVHGHYISDIYHHGSKSWIRCDDRSITSITEVQVLSHSPPRVPYLLFYQVNSNTPINSM